MIEQGVLHPYDLHDTWSPEHIPLSSGPDDLSQDDETTDRDADWLRDYEEITKDFAATYQTSE